MKHSETQLAATFPNPDGARPRFLSEADCHQIAQRLARCAKGGGYTTVSIMSRWTGNVRWARNQISSSGETRDNLIQVSRNLNGAVGEVFINDTTDVALIAASRQAERVATHEGEQPQQDLVTRLPLEPSLAPQLFNDATYQLDSAQRATAARTLMQSAAAANMLSAGYIEVSAHSMAVIDSLGRARYFPYTQAQYSVTVRDPAGTGSGWAGVSATAWNAINGPLFSERALAKCLQSRNPVAVEPGRYTTILEPQAVCDFVGQLVFGDGAALDRGPNEDRPTNQGPGPFLKTMPGIGIPGHSVLGERVMDARITISADPMDPELGFPPFNIWKDTDLTASDQFRFAVYHPATWVDHGVLTQLGYDRAFGIQQLGLSTGLPNSGAFRMSGGETSIDEMIATTKRGLVVTRFDSARLTALNYTSQLYRGYTRDGLWLIEDGKISKPVKNMVFTESILFALNRVEQLGIPQRTFHPTVGWLASPQPVIVPSLKITDFHFTALADAV